MRHEKIEYKSIEDLIPYARNQRIHSDEQVKRIAASIKEFGFKNPVIVDKEGTIIAGHGRCLAAEKLKIKELPVIVADDLNASQVKALRLADNKLQDLSEFDDELVKLELEELKGLDFDINLTGFDDLIDINALDELDDERLDEVPETPKEPRTKQGDLYIIDGKHRVLCGDSTKEEDIKRLMIDDKADMVFTDPPYGMAYNGGRTNKFKMIKGDDEDPTKFYNMLHHASEVYLWGRVENYSHLPSKPRDVIIWKKNNFGLGRGYRGQYEVCFYYGNFSGSDSDVWEVNKDINYQHPTQKPVALCERAIKNSNPKTVLDLFLGSGSTLVACEKTNRKCYGIEIDPIYCDVIIQRYKDLKPEAKIELNGECIDW